MLPMPVRIKFTQKGIMQFISHLDVDRTMKTVMVRAKIPVHYTEGFNPHPKLVFGLPLSIGVESECEYMDFKVDAEMTYGEIADKLNAALPDQMRVVEAYEPKLSLSDIAFTEYKVFCTEGTDLSPLEKEEIIVSKRQKKGGYKDTDIKPMIHSYSRCEGGFTLVLSASPDAYLRPEYVLGVLGHDDCEVTRTRVFRKNRIGEPIDFR